MSPIYTCQFYLSTNQHFTSLVQVYLQCTYLFLHCSFLWMSSILAHEVPTVHQVPIQATQQKDDTNPSCISSMLFRVLCGYYFLWMFLHPSTPSANSTSSTNSSHPTQGRYPRISFCALQGASPSWGTPFLHTPTTPRGYYLHRVPHSCGIPLMCAERVLTKFLTSRHPKNA